MGGEVAQYYKRDAEKYEKRRFRRGGKLEHEVEMNNILTLLDPRPQNLILDVGGGTGRFERTARKFGSSIVSSDLTREMLDVAKESTKAFLVRADAFRLPFKNNTFDKCVSLRLLFHFNDEDKEQILKEIIRVTKRKGTVVFDLQSSGGLLNAFMQDSLNFPIDPRRLEQILQGIPGIGYELHFSFFVPRGIYRHMPKAFARVLLSVDRIVPDVVKYGNCSTLFCRVVLS